MFIVEKKLWKPEPKVTLARRKFRDEDSAHDYCLQEADALCYELNCRRGESKSGRYEWREDRYVNAIVFFINGPDKTPIAAFKVKAA